MLAKPSAGLPKPVTSAVPKKYDTGTAPAAGSSAAGSGLPTGPRGARAAIAPGQLSPAVDAKMDKPAVNQAGGKEGGSKSAKSTPSTTPSVLLKDKDLKKGVDKAGNSGEKSETDGAETPRTGGQTPKRFSLYLKGLPTPTSEAEIKAFFGAEAEKVSIYVPSEANIHRLRPSSSSTTP